VTLNLNERPDLCRTDYAPYVRAARRRAAAERRALQARYRSAWALARRAAALLRERYAVERVVVFGSLLQRDRFTVHSDVDLAVWGIPWPAYLHALGEVLDLGGEISVELVDVESCHPLLRDVIEREGVAV